MPRPVILGGARTPFVKAGTAFAELDVLDLARGATGEALARTEVDPRDIDEVIFGNVARPVAYHNLAREVVLSLSMPTRIPAFTVGLACASACVAITSATDHILGGTADVVVAGGSESLTNVPLTLTPRLARALIAASQAKSLPAKAQSLADVRASDIAPVAPGIRETSTGLTMGESAERMAAMNEISRADQDSWALRSHQRAAAGWDDGRLAEEVAPFYLNSHAVTDDNHIRRDSTIEKLASLRPVFDREHGTITAGNASPLTDGAAAVILASEARAKELGREPLAAIKAYAYAAVDPADQLLIAPAYAIGYLPPLVIMPIMMRPMPTASAMADPDMPAKIMLATTLTWPRPPRKRPTSTRQNCNSRSVRLPMFMRSAARMKSGIASST